MNQSLIKTTGVALLLGAIFLNPLFAQADNVRFYGAWQDGGDYSSVGGYGIRLSLGAPFGIELGYNRFDTYELELNDTLNVDIEGVDADIWDLGLRLGLPLEFYLGGGLSYHMMDDRESLIDDELGFYALGGWSLGGDHWRGFGEAIFRYAEGTIDYIVGEEDVGLESWGVNAGLMYQW